MAAIEASLLSGATIGLSIAAPFGPSSMLCIQRTLAGGFLAGLASGLGVATVHLTYGSVVSLSTLQLAPVLEGNLLFPLISSVLLLGFAVRILRSVVVLEAKARPSHGLAITYLSAVMFGFFNPLTPVLFMALSPSLSGPGLGATNWVVLGLFCGSVLWWLTLTAFVSCFRGSLTPRLLNASNKAAGLMLALMAVMLIVRGYAGTGMP